MAAMFINLSIFYFLLPLACSFVRSEEPRPCKSNYERYTLLTTNITSMDHVEALLFLREKYDEHQPARKILIFDDVILPKRGPIKIIVSPDEREFITRHLTERGVPYTQVNNDIQRVLTELDALNGRQRVRYNYVKEERGEAMAPNYFLSYGEMQELFQNWTKLVPDVAKPFIVGGTYLGRDIIGVAVSADQVDRPAIWIDAGIDSSVWLTSATALFIAFQVIFGANPEVARLRDTYRWYIVPTVNPDGYEYSRTEDRFWRKTRKPYADCFGVDLNRNFNASWSGAGTSPDPCSDRYRGPEAFSEVEARSLRDAIGRVSTPSGDSNVEGDNSGLLAYFSIQGYGQFILAPWSGRDMIKPEDYDYLHVVGKTGRKAAQETFSTNGEFKFGTAPDLKYPISGSVLDWVKQSTSTKWTYAINVLPAADCDKYPIGASVPATAVFQSGIQVLQALTAMLDEIAEGPVVDLLEMFGDGERQERSKLDPSFDGSTGEKTDSNRDEL